MAILPQRNFLKSFVYKKNWVVIILESVFNFFYLVLSSGVSCMFSHQAWFFRNVGLVCLPFMFMSPGLFAPFLENGHWVHDPYFTAACSADVGCTTPVAMPTVIKRVLSSDSIISSAGLSLDASVSYAESSDALSSCCLASPVGIAVNIDSQPSLAMGLFTTSHHAIALATLSEEELICVNSNRFLLLDAIFRERVIEILDCKNPASLLAAFLVFVDMYGRQEPFETVSQVSYTNLSEALVAIGSALCNKIGSGFCMDFEVAVASGIQKLLVQHRAPCSCYVGKVQYYGDFLEIIIRAGYNRITNIFPYKSDEELLLEQVWGFAMLHQHRLCRWLDLNHVSCEEGYAFWGNVFGSSCANT
jgi:hypothetical protein